MFRRWPTILSDTLPENTTADQARQRDADVIMTATILGFTAGRLAQGHPVAFTYDHADQGTKKATDMEDAVKRINAALRKDYSFDRKATAAAAPEWRIQEMISASPGTASAPFDQRHRLPRAAAAQTLRGLASATGEDAIGYQGPGAYTGFVDDPINPRGSIKSTKRYNVPAEGYGERWVPDAYVYSGVGDQADMPWGLLGGQRSVGKGMLEQPVDPSLGVVGYTHGMIQAIYDSAWTGPWCTPYEIAVGTETTKLASCFTCTLFMYANGYPPSAIHLGQGASWVPFYEERPEPSASVGHVLGTSDESLVDVPLTDRRKESVAAKEKEPVATMEEDDDRSYFAALRPQASERLVGVGVLSSPEDELVPLIDESSEDSDIVLPKARKPEPYTYRGSENKYVPLVDSVVAALNERWRIECRQHLRLGIDIMKQEGGAAVETNRRTRIAVLEAFLAERKDDLYAAANLILDAVTVHDGEVARIIRTLRAA